MPTGSVTIEADATLTPDEVNAAYAWVEWPQREPWRVEAISRTSTWFVARDGDELVGIARLLDDGGLHASLWDVIVRPDRQRQGIGTRLIEETRKRLGEKSKIVLLSAPEAREYYPRIGFTRHESAWLLRAGDELAGGGRNDG